MTMDPGAGVVSAFFSNQVSSGISALHEISNPLLFVSYFASQRKGINVGVYFFDVCYAN